MGVGAGRVSGAVFGVGEETLEEFDDWVDVGGACWSWMRISEP